MNYELVEYTVELDEYGDRSKVVAVSKSKPALTDYCRTKYGKDPINGQPSGYDNYYRICESQIEVVIG